MDARKFSASGAVLFLSGASAIAQESAATKVTATSACASCPPPSYITVPPSDPTWFVAGLVTGLVVGYIAGKVLGRKSQ